MEIRTKRIYEPASKSDGYRVLVDRLWPRGIAKDKARIDLWAKDLAPSNELRKAYKDHDPKKFGEFTKKYRVELRANSDAVDAFLAGVTKPRLTLLYASKDEERNHALVLKECLEEQIG